MSESTTFLNAEKPLRFEARALSAAALTSQPQAAAQVGYAETWLYDNTILAIQVKDVERATVDAWVQRNNELRLGWADSTRPIFMLIAFGDEIDAMPPYAREKAREMNAMRPELTTVIAVIVPNSMVGKLLKMILWSLSQAWQTTTVRIFSDADAAHGWLKRQVDYRLTPAVTL